MLHGRLSFLSFVTTIYLVVATGDSQLTSLSPKYRAAPWKRFTDPKDKVQLFSKQPGEDFTVAVLKVTVVTKAPLDMVLGLFLSERQEVISKWNPYMGTVRQLGASTQLQTYQMPWPFVARDYIVQCKNTKQSHQQSHRTHCIPHETHPDVPYRTDRERGVSETLWAFTTERGADGGLVTRITFEGMVDPRGRLPSWVCNLVGKRSSFNIVAGLARLADATWEASTSVEKAPPAGFWSYFGYEGNESMYDFALLFIGFNAFAFTLYTMLFARRASSTASLTSRLRSSAFTPQWFAPAEPPPPAPTITSLAEPTAGMVSCAGRIANCFGCVAPAIPPTTAASVVAK